METLARAGLTGVSTQGVGSDAQLTGDSLANFGAGLVNQAATAAAVAAAAPTAPPMPTAAAAPTGGAPTGGVFGKK